DRRRRLRVVGGAGGSADRGGGAGVIGGAEAAAGAALETPPAGAALPGRAGRRRAGKGRPRRALITLLAVRFCPKCKATFLSLANCPRDKVKLTVEGGDPLL